MKRGDAEREQHFEQTFSHKLGSLTDTSTGGAGTPAGPAVGIRRCQPISRSPPSDWLTLRTGPEDLRRAIMLNEILQRPKIVGDAPRGRLVARSGRLAWPPMSHP